MSLFARSFLLIALLLVTAVLASFQIYRIYEREPRSRELAQQTVSTVNLTRAALVSADPFLRRRADPVAEVTDAVRERIARMIQTMHDARGIGLAATQVGWNARLAIVSGTGSAGRTVGRAAGDGTCTTSVGRGVSSPQPARQRSATIASVLMDILLDAGTRNATAAASSRCLQH